MNRKESSIAASAALVLLVGALSVSLFAGNQGKRGEIYFTSPVRWRSSA